MFNFCGFTYEEIEYIQSEIMLLIEEAYDGLTTNEIYGNLENLCDKDEEIIATLLEELEIEQKIEIIEDKYYCIGAGSGKN